MIFSIKKLICLNVGLVVQKEGNKAQWVLIRYYK